MPALEALIDTEATAWLAGTAHRGRVAAVAALLAIEPLVPTAPEWELGTGRWEALCSADTDPGHLTLLLKVVAGNWQVRYLHLG